MKHFNTKPAKLQLINNHYSFSWIKTCRFTQECCSMALLGELPSPVTESQAKRTGGVCSLAFPPPIARTEKSDPFPYAISCGSNVALVSNSIRNINCGESLVTSLFFADDVKVSRMSTMRKQPVLITGLQNGLICVWTALTGKLLQKLCGHSGEITRMKVSPGKENLLMSTSTDSTLIVWNLTDDGAILCTLKAYLHPGAQRKFSAPSVTKPMDSPLLCCNWAWNESNVIAFSGAQTTISICERDSNTSWNARSELCGHRRAVNDVSFSKDGALLLSGSADTTVRLWDVHAKTCMSVFGHTRDEVPRNLLNFAALESCSVKHVQFMTDGLHFTTQTEDGYIRSWMIYRPKQSENTIKADAVTCTINHDTSCLGVCTSQGKVKMYSCHNSVPELSQLCRRVLRLMLHRNIIQQLSVPDDIKCFLRYEDVPQQHVVEESGASNTTFFLS